MRNLNVPMYDPEMVRPMREELTRLGFAELRTPAEVDAVLASERAPTLVVVNSVCGCAARNARPAAALAIQHDRRPARLVTVFAGQDADATARARSYFTGYGPSSPQIALFKDGRSCSCWSGATSKGGTRATSRPTSPRHSSSTADYAV